MGDAANAMWIRSVHKYDCCLHTIYLEPNWYCIFAWNTEMISTMKSFTHQKRRHESPTLFSTRNRVLMWGVNCGYPLLKILLSDGSLHRGQDSCQWDCNRFVPKPEVESVRSGWDLLCFFDILCFLAPHKGVWRNWQSGIVWFIDQFCIRYHTLSWLIEHDKAPSKVFELSLFGWCETTPGYLCGWSCQWWNQPRQQSSHEQIHDAVRWRCTRGEISSNDLFIWLESCERRLSTCRVNWMRSPSCWFVFPWEKKTCRL